jgi:zinc transporter, ZIP family
VTLPYAMLLGAVAGSTVFLTLPLGRVKHVSERKRSFLVMVSLGVLLFLIGELIGGASEPIEEALADSSTAAEESGDVLLLFLLFCVGLAVGLIGIPALESRLRAWSSSEASASEQADVRRLAMMIAAGLGLQNLVEGLAIGQAAAGGLINLAALLIVGFGVQNATEGFSIAGPLMGSRPPRRFLAMAGAVVAVPTLLGTIVGYRLTSEPLLVFILAMAIGVIVYELGDLYRLGLQPGMKATAMQGLFVGFLLVLASELVFETLRRASET